MRAGDEVNLEIEEQGYQVDKELDVVVYFITPIQPRCYFSYWHLMSPSNQKFGQRVWVLIQVVPRREDSLPDLMESLLTLNEVEQNNLSHGKTKQDTSENPRLGDSIF